VENGTMRKITVDDELAAARLRLQEAAPLLNAAVALAQRRAAQARRSPLEDLLGKATPTSYDNSPSAVADYKNGSASGSESGSTSGSESGSASGSRSGGMSKALIERFLAGDREAGLALMGLR
jgi:membrane protein involved in colicin uptake